MTWLPRVISSALAPLCIWAAVLQQNDPDPLRWQITYICCAVVFILHAMGRLPKLVGLVGGILLIGWSATLAVRVFGRQPLFDEEGREMFGLLVLGAWMLAMGGLTGRRTSSR